MIKNPALSFIANKLATELFGTNHEFDKQVLDVLKRYGGNGPGTLEANRNDHIPYVMTLKAYEASYCTGSDFWCGGPDNQTLLPGTRHTQGVHFNLYFAFSSEDGSAPGTAVFFRPESRPSTSTRPTSRAPGSPRNAESGASASANPRLTDPPDKRGRMVARRCSA